MSQQMKIYSNEPKREENQMNDIHTDRTDEKEDNTTYTTSGRTETANKVHGKPYTTRQTK